MKLEFSRTRLVPKSDMAAATTIGRITKAYADFNIYTLTGDRLAEAHELGLQRIGPNIASLETMRKVQEKTSLGILGMTRAQMDGVEDPGNQSPLVGIYGVLPLTGAGTQAVIENRFNAIDPDFDHVCDKGDEPGGVFAWGVATTAHDAASLIILVTVLVGDYVTPHLDWYARAVTPDGKRLLIDKMGWVNMPDSPDGLVKFPAYNSILKQKAQDRSAA
jgi:hypothetical protein